jgi:hypothetical protein
MECSRSSLRLHDRTFVLSDYNIHELIHALDQELTL